MQPPSDVGRGNSNEIEGATNTGDTEMNDEETSHQQKQGGYQESNSLLQKSGIPWGSNTRYRRERNDDDQKEELQELTLMSLNIRGFNGEEKQHVIGELIHREKFHVVCLNETKLTIPVYLDNYWSHQTMLQRNGGTWTAATNQVNMSLVKSLGTYLCWTRVTSGSHVVQLLNCYLEPGEEQFKVERAKRVTDIIKDIVK